MARASATGRVGAPPTGPHAALANVQLPITDRGRVAVGGQFFTATGGRNPMSAYKTGVARPGVFPARSSIMERHGADVFFRGW